MGMLDHIAGNLRLSAQQLRSMHLYEGRSIRCYLGILRGSWRVLVAFDLLGLDGPGVQNLGELSNSGFQGFRVRACR